MDMLGYLEEDKKQLLSGLVQAGTPAQAQAVVEKELDRLVYRYNENCEDEHVRDAALYMMQSARMMVPVMSSAGETRIWEQSVLQEKGESKGRRMSVFSILSLAAGIVLVGGSVVALGIFSGGALTLPFLLKSIPVVLLGGALLFLGGRLSVSEKRHRSGSGKNGKNTGNRKNSEGEGVQHRVEILVDPDKIWSCLRSVVLVMDKNLEHVRQEAEYDRSRLYASVGNGISGEEADLFSGLLELAYGQRAERLAAAAVKNRDRSRVSSEDAAAAEEMIGLVRYYLHRRQVEVVDFEESGAGGKREWFELLPGTSGSTIRPALVREGELIRKGLATKEG